MIITKGRIASAIATGALLFNTFATSAFAATSIEISGNGSFSNNKANVNKNINTTVVQNNDAKVKNTVNSEAKTGGNNANDNTGGDVTIATGNARSNVDLKTKVNLNHAEVNNCDCESDVEVKIAENGSDSKNDADVHTNNNTSLFQDNKADIDNYVDAKSNTGKNDADRNTGGDVTVITGHAETNVDVKNAANANIAHVGSDNENGAGGGKVSARIVGNGSFSDNKINLDVHRSVNLVQDNNAYINNWIDAKSKTGKNNANDNTSGDVLIDTGKAKTNVDVKNAANFNFAEIDCGCLLDVDAKVAENGSYSDNMIWANLNEHENVYQDSKADLENWVDAKAKTGKNNANRNTGDVQSDPAIVTGHADSEQRVSNFANANLFGNSGESELELELDFDLGSVLGFFHR